VAEVRNLACELAKPTAGVEKSEHRVRKLVDQVGNFAHRATWLVNRVPELVDEEEKSIRQQEKLVDEVLGTAEAGGGLLLRQRNLRL